MTKKSPKTFITDDQWQKRQHARLLDMADDPKRAQALIEKMDSDPVLRQGLWDIYCRAMKTLGLLES